MDAVGGELHLDQPIPRVHHALLPGEDSVDVLRRMAQSVAFAFFIDPEQTTDQPDFEISTETIVLPDGVVARSQLRGKVTLIRDDARVAITGADQLFVFILEAGAIDVQPTRSGRRMRGGDILVVDLAQSVTLMKTDHIVTMMVFARGLLPESVRYLDFHCSEVRGDHPLARVIAKTVDCLWEDSRLMTQVQGSVVLRAVIDMLALALTDARRTRNAPRMLKASAEALIADHISDRALSPGWIAARLHVSRATLYRAFTPYGGVVRFIDDRRLQSAWVLVSSPDGPPISDIAARCGYQEALASGVP